MDETTKANRVRKPCLALRVQCGEGGGGKEKESIGPRVWHNGGTDYRSPKRRTYEATPTGLVIEPKESCTGTRRTETCVAPRQHVNASGDTPLTISVCCTIILLCSFFYFFLRTSSVGGGRLLCQTFLCLSSFPCSADHNKRDRPPCKVPVFLFSSQPIR